MRTSIDVSKSSSATQLGKYYTKMVVLQAAGLIVYSANNDMKIYQNTPLLFLETYGIMCHVKTKERVHMKQETENAIRSIASLDPEVSTAMVDRAIDLMRGRSDESEAFIHNVKFRDAQDLLKVSRRTLSYYLDHGYLDRVYGCGHRALGISRESLLRFMNRRVVRRRDPQTKNLMTVHPSSRKETKI